MGNFGVTSATFICLFTACSPVVVGLRLYTRIRLSKMSGLDDAIITFSLVRSPQEGCFLFQTDIMARSLTLSWQSYIRTRSPWVRSRPHDLVVVDRPLTLCIGTGRHIDTMHEAQAVHAVKIEVITNSILDHTFSWPKLSIVILLCRVFEPVSSVKFVGYCLACLSILFSCLITIFNYTQCSPASGFWNHEIGAKCWPAAVFSDYSIGACCR